MFLPAPHSNLHEGLLPAPTPIPSSHGPSLPPAHWHGGSHSTALFPREQCLCVTDNNVLSSQALPQCMLGCGTKGTLYASEL